MRIFISLLTTLILVLICNLPGLAQITTNDYSARLDNNVLILENSKISRTYVWNGGNLITRSLIDKISGKEWFINSTQPDLCFPGQSKNAANAEFSVRLIFETSIVPEHLEAEVTYTLDQLQLKRIFRIYKNCPAIACDLYFRGKSDCVWIAQGIDFTDWENLQKLTVASAGNFLPVTEKMELPGKHWELEIVEFMDYTDRLNNLVKSVKALSYMPDFYRGNLLFAHDKLSDHGIFILKEAPASIAQIAYTGGDFITRYGTFMVIGAGLTPSDLDTIEWRHGYGFVTGVYSGDEKNRLVSLREYQENLRIHKPERDEMVLMNTWGDLSLDRSISEKFALDELDAGARLGISHFQLDAGWQKGNVPWGQSGYFNDIWGKNDFWDPHPIRFPKGFYPVMKKGSDLGIEICLWFNPCGDNSNELWEKDADALIGFNKQYGIRTFKIDGINLEDKRAEENFRKFLAKIQKATNFNVVFNFDVTYGRRGGYHYLNEYGNIFLENRFTDWGNYYPYTTLRNLWMLSKYVPSQNLQIEVLNKWRNINKYQDDAFGPANYSFGYLFAIAMAGQPLLWLEGTGLPGEAFSIAPVIKKYHEIQFDFHSGKIFPVGEEPSGKSWTGFQSLQSDRGYFLIFRENNEKSEYNMDTWLTAGTKVTLTPVSGTGKDLIIRVNQDGTIKFTLKGKNSYVLYKYRIVN